MAKHPQSKPGWVLRHHRSELEERAQKAALELDLLQNSLERVITGACMGTLTANQLTRPAMRAFCAAIEGSSKDKASRASLAKLLRFVHDRADFLCESVEIGGRQLPYVNGLIKLNDRRKNWLAQPEAWKVPSHNSRRQFSSLARHLVAHFPVPDFMDEAWLDTAPGTRRLRDWFVHIGLGKNIRTAKTPIPMTKMMAHHFLEAPGSFGVLGAIRWGQVRALGGDRRLTEALLGSRLGTVFAHDAFWATVIRFLAANPMLDRRHIGPIIDYIFDQRFESLHVVREDGETEEFPPPQPNLSMRGRSATSLLAAVDRWHGELGKRAKVSGRVFKKSGVLGLQLADKDGKPTWRIRELLSPSELALEGRIQKHCVVTYAASCEAGECSIWTMEKKDDVGFEKHQTIEVRRRTIVQCRGRLNRLPSRGEFNILETWARLAGLSIGPYVPVED